MFFTPVAKYFSIYNLTFLSFSKALNLIGLEISVKIIYLLLFHVLFSFCGCFYDQPSHLTILFSISVFSSVNNFLP